MPAPPALQRVDSGGAGGFACGFLPLAAKPDSAQNCRRRENCRRRSVPAWVLVILPKLPLPPSAFASARLASGVLKTGVFARLKASARNCIFHFSLNRKSLNVEKSSVLVGGPVAAWSPRLPPVSGAATL